LWAKMTVTHLLPVWLLVALISYRHAPTRAVLVVAGTVLVGSFLFLATFWAYCRGLHLSMEYTFRFLLDSFLKGTNSTQSRWERIGGNLAYLRTYIFWLMPLTAGLMLAATTATGLKAWRDRDVAARDIFLLAGMGLFVTVFYLGLISPFGGFYKYPFATFTFLVLPLAYLGAQFLHDQPRILWVMLLALILAIGTWAAARWGDAALREARHCSVTALRIGIGVALSLGVLLGLYSRQGLARILFLLLIALGVGLELGVSRTQATAAYPTRYHYGRQGFEEAVAYLRSRVGPDEVIWGMKDVGYYVNNRYIESYGYYFVPALADDLVALFKGGKVRYYVASRGIGEDQVEYYPIKALLEQYCRVERTFGNTIIYITK
ncbi:MAG: hypothetical protein WCI73_13285, partial [Phycisphaerae bacterium]